MHKLTTSLDIQYALCYGECVLVVVCGQLILLQSYCGSEYKPLFPVGNELGNESTSVEHNGVFAFQGYIN